MSDAPSRTGLDPAPAAAHSDPERRPSGSAGGYAGRPAPAGERQAGPQAPGSASPDGSGGQAPRPRSPRPLGAARRRLRRLGLPVAAAALLVLAVATFLYWRANAGLIKTDNAQTAGDLAPVSSRITGTVTKVDVQENQLVKAGTVLVELDPSDYRLALSQARSQLAVAQAQVQAAQAGLAAQEQQFASSVSAARAALEATQPRLPQAQAQLVMQEGTTAAQVAQAEAQVATARSNVQAAQATFTTASRTLERDRRLLADGAIAAQQVDADTAAYAQARAQYQAAQDALRQAQATLAAAQAARQQVAIARNAVAENRGQVSQAEAQLQQALAGAAVVRQRAQELAAAQAQAAAAAQAVRTAELNLSRTLIRAPADGWVTNRTVQIGQVVQPNQPLMSLTLSRGVWVVANIKETQLGRIRVGDPVRIRVDALPGRTFHGHVESIGAATGSTTALLPPDNATGNFVKVVQLVPVRIALDPGTDPDQRLQVGLSAEVAIDTTHHRAR